MRLHVVLLLFVLGLVVGGGIGFVVGRYVAPPESTPVWADARPAEDALAPQDVPSGRPEVEARAASVWLEQLRALPEGADRDALRARFAARFPNSWVLQSAAWRAGRVP